MIKKIIFSVIILVVLCLSAGVYFLGNIVRSAVNDKLPGLLGVDVHVDDIELSVIAGTAAITNLRIGNPEGFSGRDMITVKEVAIKLDIVSLLKDTIVVRQVMVTDPFVNYEFGLGTSNISVLKKHLEKDKPNADTSSSAPSSSEDAADPSENKPPRFVIDHLVITGGTAKLGVGPMGQTINLPDVNMRDVGKKKGLLTPREIASLAVKGLLKTFAQRGVRGLVGEIGGAIRGVGQDVDAISKGIGKLF